MKKQAFKLAWEYFKKFSVSFSQALKEGWKQAKLNYYSKKIDYYYKKRELLISLNYVYNFTQSDNKKPEKYFKLMSFIKSEISFWMLKKDSCLDKSNYKFTFPLNVSFKSI